MLKKAVYTLIVDNYFPELCKLTNENHRAYANKIGADYIIINKRRYPEWWPTYEKVQIFEIGVQYDWCLHIDADVLVHPELKDITAGSPDTIKWYSIYDPALYFKCDQYFTRDGRQIGVCSAMLAVPRMCHDLWEPFDCTYEEALKGINKPHGIDDYCFSRNLAKYGLNGDFIFYEGEDVTQIQHLGVGGIPENKKETLKKAETLLKNWGSV
jgi:alpha-N-acetylglucosamine transferase